MENKIREIVKNFEGSRMHVPGEPFILYLISELEKTEKATSQPPIMLTEIYTKSKKHSK